MAELNIAPISAFTDNYIWCIHDQHNCVIVDPGDARPVIDFITAQQLSLTAILITHHHWDHTNGLEGLLSRYGQLPVYGPYSSKIDEITHPLKEGDSFRLSEFDLLFEVLEVPGHTLDHIALVSRIGLFCGDTLFSAGCGRLFEGSAAQMHRSMSKLAGLPDALPVYCAHEYTVANLNFAENVDPNNDALQQRKSWAQNRRKQDLPTLPSSIELEKQINPFLRVNAEEIHQAAENKSGEILNTPEQVFAVIRHWKDNF